MLLSRWACRALLPGILCLVTLLVGCTGEENLGLAETRNDPPQQGCWVFHHMHRSGEDEVKSILQTFMSASNERRGMYGSTAWRRGDAFARDFIHHNHTVTWGAYAEALRSHSDARDCKWFTIFRHPVARVVSAYFYCREDESERRMNSLCGPAAAGEESDAGLIEFAEHWGNAGLRHFALAFLLPDEVINSAVAQRCRDCPSWYILKLYLEGGPITMEEAFSAVTVNSTSVSLDSLLMPAEELLGSRYAAVGIYDNLDATFGLFNRALELPGLDWQAEYEGRYLKSRDGSADAFVHKKEMRALETLWEHSMFKKYLALDLLFYDHALAVHAAQIERYAGR